MEAVNKIDPIARGMSLRNEICQRLQKKDYLLTVRETGDYLMGGGEVDRMVSPRRFYKICSLEEIPEMIEKMRVGFWQHPDLKDGMSEIQKNKIPFEEKKWGRYCDLDITPLSEEKVELFQHYIDSGLLNDWRSYGQDEDTQTTA